MDQVEQNRAEIAKAVERAEAQRNAKANRVDVEALRANMAFARSPEALIPSPRNWLEMQFNERLGAWMRVRQTQMSGRPDHEFFKPRAVAALEMLDNALELLGARTGNRAESTRTELLAQRHAIASAVNHFDSLGADLRGSRAIDLEQRITASRAALAAAYAARENAKRETVESALLEIEKELAESRQLDRELATAVASLALPALPSAADFEKARTATRDLESQPGKRPSARAVHAAISAGMTADPNVSRLWVVYESAAEHELVKWRARAAAGE